MTSYAAVVPPVIIRTGIAPGDRPLWSAAGSTPANRSRESSGVGA
ncbi:hypothetical protein ACWC1D_00790 [Streptomyces sp. NPDC001478]